MLKLRKTTPGEPLILAMTAVRMGDRLLIVGGSDPDVVAKLATRPGLTGRTCAVDDQDGQAARAAAAAEREGALVEHQTAPCSALPYAAETFDVVVINHLLPSLPAEHRVPCLAEAARVLRTGGRCVVVQSAERTGLSGLFGRGPSMPSSEVESAMTSAGFRAVRTLATREGMTFVEGGRR